MKAQIDAANKIKQEQIEKQKKMFINICMYAWCAAYSFNKGIKEYDDIIKSLQHKYNPKYQKCLSIAQNLGLSKELIEEVFANARYQDKCIINKILFNMNEIVNDDTMTEEDKITAIFKKFPRISENEVTTPLWICEKMVNEITVEKIQECLEENQYIVVIAEKIGEYSIALYKHITENLGYSKEVARKVIGCIPQSYTAYEMCHKTYTMFGLDPDNITLWHAFELYDKIAESQKTNKNNADYAKIAETINKSKNGKLSGTTLDNTINKDDWKMINFGAIVGNPPYNIQANGSATGSDAIYDEFLDICHELTKEEAILITPARWMFGAGKTSKKWNEKMLQNEHLSIVEYFQNGTKIFNDAKITGGVVITKFNKNKIVEPIGFFIENNILRSIYKKVKSHHSYKSFEEIVFSRTSFRLTKKMHEDFPNAKNIVSRGHLYDMSTNIMEILPFLFLEREPKDGNKYVKVWGRINNERVLRFIKKEYINEGKNLYGYKVFVAKANKIGFGEVLSSPFTVEPGVAHTEFVISIGNFDNYLENENCFNYIKTKFARCHLGILKVTQDNPPAKWSCIPLQDFTENSDIDWSKSIPEIDQQLYAKYGLTEEEINFIETNVKAMD